MRPHDLLGQNPPLSKGEFVEEMTYPYGCHSSARKPDTRPGRSSPVRTSESDTRAGPMIAAVKCTPTPKPPHGPCLALKPSQQADERIRVFHRIQYPV